MSESATPEGVEEEGLSEILTERDRLMDAIAEKHEAKVEKEIAESGPVEEVVEEVPTPEVVAVVPKQEVKPEVQMERIRVDGTDKEVSKDEIYQAGIRALQKTETGDKRLEEATRILREAQTMVGGQQKPPTDDELTWYSQQGTPDQQVLAKNEITRRQQATVDGLFQEATRRAVEQLRFDDAAPWFAEEYKDVLTDPLLVQIAGQKATVEEERMRKGESTLTHRQAYKKVGDELRAWVTGLRGVSTGGTQTFEEKREAKSNIVNLNTASSRKTAPNEDAPESAKSIIEEMRQARGGK